MIIEVDADLLEYPLDGFGHGCNCFHTMGSGIALSIKNKYPELYHADVFHGRKGDVSRLGQFSTVKCHDDKQGYNVYTQYNFGMGKRQTNYEAVYRGLVGIRDHATDNNILKLGLPKNMGSVLGGGDWRIIRVMIEVIFGEWKNTLYICNYTPSL